MTIPDLNTDQPINTANEISPPKKFPIFKIFIITGILISIPLILCAIIWIWIIIFGDKENPNLTQKTYNSFSLYYPEYFEETLGNPGQIVFKDPEENNFG